MDMSKVPAEAIDQQSIERAEPHQREDGTTYYGSCRIPMVYEVGRGTLNMVTGESSRFTYTTKVGVCGTPLFGRGNEFETGVCLYCARAGRVPEKLYHRMPGEAVEITEEEALQLAARPPEERDR